MTIVIDGTAGVTFPDNVTQEQGLIADGTAPVYGCRAWVNFDGTRDTSGASSTANTNRLIRESGNVTSVLRNSTGNFTVTFATPMPDANYVYTVGGGTISGGDTCIMQHVTSTTTSVRFATVNTTPTAADRNMNLLMVFR